MLNHVLVAAVAGSVLIGGAVQSCRGEATLQRVNGQEPSEAVAVRVPEDTDLVLDLLVEARRLVHDTPEERLVPTYAVAARLRPDGSWVMQFPSALPPEHLYTVFLVGPNETYDDVPVWYDADADKIFYCYECLAEAPFAPEMLGLLYLRARFEETNASSTMDEASSLALERETTRFLMEIVDRASEGRYRGALKEILEDPALSEPVIPTSPWRVPTDDGWTRISAAWPWTLRSLAEQYEADDIVHLSCALLQGKTRKQRDQAFLQILEYTAQGC